MSSAKNDLAAAFIDALDADAIDRLLDRASDEALARLAGRLEPHLGAAPSDRWMPTNEAALYLGLTPNVLHKLTAARAVPFEQDCRGGKLYFKRSELDAWRAGVGVSRRAVGAT